MRLSDFLESKRLPASKPKSEECCESRSEKWTFLSLRSSKSRQSRKGKVSDREVLGVLEKTTTRKQTKSKCENKDSDRMRPSAALRNEAKMTALINMRAKDNSKPHSVKRTIEFKSHGTDFLELKPTKNKHHDEPFRRFSTSDSSDLNPAVSCDLTRNSSSQCSELDLSPDSYGNLNCFDNFEMPISGTMQLPESDQLSQSDQLVMKRIDNSSDRVLDGAEMQRQTKSKRKSTKRPDQSRSQSSMSQRSPQASSPQYSKSQRMKPYGVCSSDVVSKVRPVRMARSESHRTGNREQRPRRRSVGGERTRLASLPKEVLNLKWTVRSPIERSGTYTGASLHGMVPHGYGTLRLMNGDIYEGEFVYGEMRGNNVTYESSCGKFYEGAFLQNMKHGYGEEAFPNGSCYVGRYEHDRFQGFGIKYNPDGSIFHAGEWHEGNPVKGQINGYEIKSEVTCEMSIVSSSSSSDNSDQCNSLADGGFSVQSGRSIYSEAKSWNSAAFSSRTSVSMSDYSFLSRRRFRCGVADDDIKIACDIPIGNASGSETGDSEDERLSMYAAHT